MPLVCLPPAPTDPPAADPTSFAGFSVLVRRATSSRPHRAVVALRGRIDASAVTTLQRLRGQLGPPGTPVVVITSRVDAIDAAGLRAVLALGRSVRLSGISPAVRDALENAVAGD